MIALRALGRGARRRGHLPRRSRSTPRPRRSPPSARSRLRRHRGRDVQPRSRGASRPRITPPHARGRGGAPVRPPGRRWGRCGHLRARTGWRCWRTPRRPTARRSTARAAARSATRATFSFFPTKNLPCFGDGGLITTPSAEVDRRARCASTARGQEDVHARRLQLAARRAAGRDPARSCGRWSTAGTTAASPSRRATTSSGLGELVVLPPVAPGARHVYHLYVVRSAGARAPRAGLAQAGVGAASYYRRRCTCSRCSRTSAGARARCPVTERCARETLALPMSPTLGEAAQREVVDAVAALAPARA